jgi:tape measure domain-containing protein
MVIEELTTRLGFQVDPNGLDKGKQALGGFKKWAAGIGIAAGAAFAYLAKTGVEAAMTMESITAQFTVMTGSADRAASLIKEIADFAAHTPFTKLGLSEAGKTLMAFGMDAEKVVPTLKMLGDVAGADQNRLNSLALVFGQIQSTGKLMGQDLLQLINQGFNPLTVMAEKSGKSVAELKDLMAQGAISADDVTRAFQIATSEGGLFFGNLEAQSQTLAGKLSTLKDNFETALQNMAEAFFPLMKQMADFAIAIDWTPIVNGAQKVAAMIGDLSGLVDTLTTWLKRLSPLFLMIFGPRLRVMLTSAITQTRAYAAATLFLQRAHLAAGAAANYQLTATGLLKAGMFSATQAAKGFGAGMKAAFTGVLGSLNILLAGLAAVKELYDYFVIEAPKQLGKEFEAQTIEDFKKGEGAYSMMGGPEGYMQFWQRVYKDSEKKLKDLVNQPGASQAAIDKASQDYKDAQKMYEEGAALYKKVRGIEWSTARAKGAASQGVQQTITESNKTVKIDNKFDFEIAAPADKNTQTGLTAADVAQLANQAIDAAFNIRLKSLIVGAM